MTASTTSSNGEHSLPPQNSGSDNNNDADSVNQNTKAYSSNILLNKSDLSFIEKQTTHENGTEIQDYYFKNGLRYVKPYYFDYKSHAKGRWVGMTAVQMYTKEFSYYSVEYVQKAIDTGRITINGQKISHDREIQRNELLIHRLHRHELPILNTPLKVIPCDNDKIIVIDKPPSIPVHPCGRYRKNSMTYILQNECVHATGDLADNMYPIHRLDRMTSGILVISKSKQYAQQMTTQMTRNEIQKVYIAIVSGKWFNFDPESKELPEMTECDIKIWAKDRRAGVWEAHPELGTIPSKTCFICVAYDAKTDTSLLLCRPITGRTHQIRVHLQALNHPIANDPYYGIGADERRAQRKRKLDAAREVIAHKRQKLNAETKHEAINFDSIVVESGNACVEANTALKQRVHKEYIDRAAQQTPPHSSAESSSEPTPETDTNSMLASTSPTFDPLCHECIEETIHPVEPHELFIYLHSWVYISPGNWNVKSNLPFWVNTCFPDVSTEQMESSLEHLLRTTSHLNKESVFTEEE